MNPKTVVLCISILVWSLLFRIVRESAEADQPIGLICVLIFVFYDLVVKRPIFPYPNGKVTWPWQKVNPSGKS